MPQIQYQLPDLHAIFDGHHSRPHNLVSPAYEEVDADFIQWIDGLPFTSKQRSVS